MPSSHILQYRKYPRYSSKLRLYDRSSDNSNNPINVIQVKDISNVIIDTNHDGSVKKDFIIDQLVSGSESSLHVNSKNVNLKDISNVVFNTGLSGSNIDISASDEIIYTAPSFNLGYNSVSDIIQYTSGTANLQIDGSNNNLVLDSSNIELNSTNNVVLDSTNVILTSNNTFDIVATNVDINPINNFNIDVNGLSLNATNNVVLDSTNIVVNATDISLNSDDKVDISGNNNVTLKSGSSSSVDLSNGETNVLAGDIIVYPSTKLDISSNIVDVDADNVKINVSSMNVNSSQHVEFNNSGNSVFEINTINGGDLDMSSNVIFMNSTNNISLNNNISINGASGNISMFQTTIDFSGETIDISSNNTIHYLEQNSVEGLDISYIVTDMSLNASNNVSLHGTNKVSVLSDDKVDISGNNNVTLNSGSSSSVDLSNGETNVLAGDIVVNPFTKLDIIANDVDIDSGHIDIDTINVIMDVSNMNVNSSQHVEFNNSGNSVFEINTINGGDLDMSSNVIFMNSTNDISLNNNISINGASGNISMFQTTIDLSGETIDISSNNTIHYLEQNSVEGLDISYIVTDMSLNASNNVSLHGTNKISVMSDNNVTLKSGSTTEFDLSNGETNVLASDIIVNPYTELDISSNIVDMDATTITLDASDNIYIVGVDLELEGLTKIDASGDDVNIVSSLSTNINNQDKNEIQVTPTLIEVKNTETTGVNLLSSNIEFKSDNVMNINTQTFTQTQTHKYVNDATEDVSNVSILGNVLQTDNTTINSTDISFVSNGNEIMMNGTIDNDINVNVSNNINLETTELNVTGNKFTIEGSDLDITTDTFNVNSSSGITVDPSHSNIIFFDTANTDNSFQLLHSDVRYNFTDVAKYIYDISYNVNEHYNTNLGDLRVRFNNLEASFNSTISGEGVDTRTLKTIVDVYENLDISQDLQIYQMQSTFVDVLYRFNELVGVDNSFDIISYTISAEDIDSSFVNVVEPT
jgi:hypothetical protein